MPITLGPGDKLAGMQVAGTDVIYEINGDDRTIAGSVDAYLSLAQGALANAAAALVGPAAGHDYIIDNITLKNGGASTRVVNLYKTKASTTYDATTLWKSFTLYAGECAMFSSAGWQVFNAQGIPKQVATPGGLIASHGSVAHVTGFAADTYIDGSSLLVPVAMLRAGTTLHWLFDVSKTNAGTATPVVTIRVGANGAVGDTARVALTFSAGTAAADRGQIEVWANYESIGAAGVLAGVGALKHQLAITGLNSTTTGYQQVVTDSAAFDMTPEPNYVGLSLNAGLNAVWTINAVQAQAMM
jgi:hypothetical protein